ncbi:MAG TPA: sulfite exporter TauE/SafE family protein [Candidatus Nanoarchaeia archaeon]|nr:sulfite exporter TauE/SafE family protein [Candidatus Nanoarchaeia archaeon]
MKKIYLKIHGMTCASCELLIERKIKAVSGVNLVRVSHANGHAVVECHDHVTLSQLQAAVDQKYTLTQHKEQRIEQDVPHVREKRSWGEIGAALIVIAGIYFILKQFNVIPNNFGISDNMSYGFVFLLGLIAATSTCLAVSGGLLLSIAAKYHEKFPNLTGKQKFLPHMYFNVGRVASYTVFGALIGAVGSALTLSSQTMGFITLAASALMVIIGLQMLKIFPGLNKINIKMPKFIAHKIYDKNDDAAPSTEGAFLFGASTFFLPCGFTQALQLYVLGQGDPLIGAFTMLAFSLGTMPALMSIGALSSFVKGRTQRHVMTFAAVLIIMLGLFNVQSGLLLTGFAQPLEDIPQNQVQANVADGVQRVEMAVNGLDYVPSGFTIQKGVPVEWVVDGSNAQGCAQILSIPSMRITERLSRSEQNIIRFTPEKSGRIMFTCGMGMAGPGYFNVQ